MNGVHRLIRKRGIGHDGDHGRSSVHQRKRAVFEFTRGIALARKIADLFEFEAPLARGDIVRAPPEKKDALRTDEIGRPAPDPFPRGSRLADERLNARKRRSGLPPAFRKRARKRIQSGELRVKTFCGGDGDLPARTRRKDEIAHALQRGIRHVRDGEHARAPLFRKCGGGERIRRFAALTDRDRKRVFRHDRVRIAVFARYKRLSGEAGKLLRGMFHTQSAVVCRPTSHNMKVLCLT